MNILVIGVNKEKCTQNLNGENILITLQFTEDHTPEENKKLLEIWQLCLFKIIQTNLCLNIILASDNEINNEEMLKQANVSNTPETIMLRMS